MVRPPSKISDTITSVHAEPKNSYDKIISEISGGDIVLALNESKKDQEEDPTGFEGEDPFQPYNIVAKKTGVVNEWKDKKFEWDVLCDHLNK